MCATMPPGLVAADFDWLDARDVAALIVRTISVGPRRGRYLLAGERRSLPAHAICAQAKAVPPKMISPLWLAKATAPFVVGWARMRGSVPLYTSASLATLGRYGAVDDARARSELAWSPRPLDATIADTTRWWIERLA